MGVEGSKRIERSHGGRQQKGDRGVSRGVRSRSSHTRDVNEISAHAVIGNMHTHTLCVLCSRARSTKGTKDFLFR